MRTWLAVIERIASRYALACFCSSVPFFSSLESEPGRRGADNGHFEAALLLEELAIDRLLDLTGLTSFSGAL